MINVITQKIKSRKNFYRNLYRKEITLLVIFNIMACIWVLLIVGVAAEHVTPSFYSSSSDGILTPLRPLLKPNYSNKVMLE